MISIEDTSSHYLLEMALSRSDAVNHCISLGNQFVEHFHKVVAEGADGADFSHHCAEMNSWWDNVRRIVLKQNKKTISKTDLVDCFFTCGSDVDLIIKEPYRELYENLFISLLADYNTPVESAVTNLIN